MSEPADLTRLKAVSADLGADPLRIQGPGGNTSIKEGARMWIKASGTELAEAERRDIFVVVDLDRMRAAMAAGAPEADQPAQFLLDRGGLRPSIETSLHAVFPQRVVLHAHCVDTLALAIRADARARFAERLRDLPHGFAPYVKPGATLAKAVQASGGVEAGVVVLGNHGLIVAADTVEAAAELFDRVTAALAAAPAAFPAPDMAALDEAGGAAYAPPPADHPLHGVALSPHRLQAALGGSLYPDHVIFCGVAATALAPGESADTLVARLAAAGLAPPPLLLVPGRGALIARQATAGARALARCLGDVLARVPEGAPLSYLTDRQNAELIDWDAEKYRRALNVA
ncbi:MAG TPA: class II aldolase/adducin family protein [Roseiarcus sp.]|nr:class II aldolase/adducin family protein [Roseiarcus sp.]